MFKLLIVDDEPIIRNGLRNTIDWMSMGYESPSVASNGNQALAMILEENYQVVLTDIKMPGLNGIELITRIRQIRPQTVIVIISGHKDFEYAHAAVKYHVEDYILKPISKKRIIETFSRIATILQNRITEYEKLEREQTILKQYLINLLIHGSVEEALHLAEENNILFEGPEASVIILRLPEKESFSLGVATLKEHDELLPVSYLKEQDRLVSCVPTVHLPLLLKQIKSVFEQTGNTYQMGIGNSYQTLDGIKYSYNEALKALNTAQNNKETYYQEGKRKDKDNTSRLSKKDLLTYLLAQDEERAIAEIHCIFSHAKRENMEELYHWCVSVIFELKEYLKSVNRHDLGFLSPQQSSAILEENDYELLERVFIGAIQDFLRSFQNVSSNQERIVAKTIAMVNERYMDKSLSLQRISEELQISFSYLSTIFKSVYKKNFSSYLLDVRMAQAFQLIQSGNYKIYEVADKVGFSNARYFTETYKKYFSVTPSKSTMTVETP